MTPETKLFRAVINQAIEDVIEPSISIRSFDEWVIGRRRRRDEAPVSERSAYDNYVDAMVKINNVIVRNRDEAAKWLTRDSNDFRFICRYADLEPSYVIMKVKSAEILMGRL